ncbi:MAG: methionyl-tRNA formyltransferase [Bacillota bacterium]|nr:methionyl-tRNA formyltransferase [Bacillota bacterium]
METKREEEAKGPSPAHRGRREGGSIRPILDSTRPEVRRKARPVRRITRQIWKLLDDMAVTMYDADGVGLAAPQIGVDLRVIVVDVGDGLIEMINPELLKAEGEQTGYEGCLSVPGYVGEVTRARHVRVTGLDREGRRLWVDAEDFKARAFQHELDHLDGVLYVDKAQHVVRLPPETAYRLVFMGTPEFGVTVLRRLARHGFKLSAVVTQPDRRRGRGQALLPSPVKRQAQEYGVTVLEPENPRDPAFVERLRELRPDVIVTAAYGFILPPEVLAVPGVAALNVHPSLLPRYRGPAPIERALMAGERETGVSIIRMSERVDAGEVLAQRAVRVEEDDDAGSLGAKLAAAGAELLIEVLHRFATGEEVVATPQDEALATRAPKIRPEEERLDWSRPAVELVNRIRALSPRPGAYTLRRGERLKVFRAEAAAAAEAAGGPAAGGTAGAAPGEVVAVDARSAVVACGPDGGQRIRLLEVQPAGRRRMSMADFLRGNPLERGERLG